MRTVADLEQEIDRLRNELELRKLEAEVRRLKDALAALPHAPQPFPEIIPTGPPRVLPPYRPPLRWDGESPMWVGTGAPFTATYWITC